MFRRSRLFPCLALALALLLAQAGAFMHAVGHLDAQRDTGGIHSQLCGECLSFSSIFSMAGGPNATLAVPYLAIGWLALAALASLVDRSTPRAFRARAPPAPR